jgi:glycosyltransferase involved in cell wall biosynthesis
MTTVCLALMAKNEAHIIARALASARPLVDTWIVLDTGSTDTTREVAREAMSGIPGEVIDRPWRNFGESRTESFELARARADYVLVLDCDDELEYASGTGLPELTEPGYALMIHDGTHLYPRLQILKSAHPWRYEGVRHDHAVSDVPIVPVLIEGIVYRRFDRGARTSDPEKYLKDAAALEEDLRRDPTNRRSVFYLARSYEDAGSLPRALAQYERRMLMGGWDEEVFYAALCAARVREGLGFPREVVARAYLEAWHLRPHRAEPLFELARLARLAEDWVRARAYASAAGAIAFPKGDTLFIHHEIYTWRALNELAGACAHLGDFRMAIEANRLLLQSGRLPSAERDRVQANLTLCQSSATKTES